MASDPRSMINELSCPPENREVRVWQRGIPTVVGGVETEVDVLFNFTDEGLIIDVVSVVDPDYVPGTSSETYEELASRLIGEN